jgi:hypothetical protein
MKDRIPDQVFREIFPRRLEKHRVIPNTYNPLKKNDSLRQAEEG